MLRFRRFALVPCWSVTIAGSATLHQHDGGKVSASYQTPTKQIHAEAEPRRVAARLIQNECAAEPKHR